MERKTISSYYIIHSNYDPIYKTLNERIIKFDNLCASMSIQGVLNRSQDIFFGGGSVAITSSCRRTANMKTFSTFSCTPYLSLEFRTGSKLSFLPSNGTSARR
jgi:hypothetical protein